MSGWLELLGNIGAMVTEDIATNRKIEKTREELSAFMDLQQYEKCIEKTEELMVLNPRLRKGYAIWAIRAYSQAKLSLYDGAINSYEKAILNLGDEDEEEFKRSLLISKLFIEEEKIIWGLSEETITKLEKQSQSLQKVINEFNSGIGEIDKNIAETQEKFVKLLNSLSTMIDAPRDKNTKASENLKGGKIAIEEFKKSLDSMKQTKSKLESQKNEIEKELEMIKTILKKRRDAQ